MAGRFGVRLYKQRFNFASAHFLLFEDGRREELHGHNYQVRIELDGAGLDGAGMVADFIAIKPVIKAACDALDHRVLLPRDAPALKIQLSEAEVEVRVSDGARFVFPRRDVLVLPLANTSTELLARYLAGELERGLAAVMPAARIGRLRVEVEESGGQCGWFERTPKGGG